MVIEKARHWQPYRSIASMYLWQAGRLRLTRADLLNAG
jgi:3-methyladenine DNA glycosylase/8-oxoguanine DNA glycosylase